MNPRDPFGASPGMKVGLPAASGGPPPPSLPPMGMVKASGGRAPGGLPPEMPPMPDEGAAGLTCPGCGAKFALTPMEAEPDLDDLGAPPPEV